MSNNNVLKLLQGESKSKPYVPKCSWWRGHKWGMWSEPLNRHGYIYQHRVCTVCGIVTTRRRCWES